MDGSRGGGHAANSIRHRRSLPTVGLTRGRVRWHDHCPRSLSASAMYIFPRAFFVVALFVARGGCSAITWQRVEGRELLGGTDGRRTRSSDRAHSGQHNSRHCHLIGHCVCRGRSLQGVYIAPSSLSAFGFETPPPWRGGGGARWWCPRRRTGGVRGRWTRRRTSLLGGKDGSISL